MTGDSSDGTWLARRRRYRRLSLVMIAAGVVGFAVADVAGSPALGVGIYWTGIIGFIAVRWRAPMALSDERDCALERRASYDAVRLAGVALVVLAPGAASLDELGYFEPPAVLVGALLGYAALFGVFGVAYLVRRRRS